MDDQKSIFSLSIDEQGRKHFSSIVHLTYAAVLLASAMQLIGIVANIYAIYTASNLPGRGGLRNHYKTIALTGLIYVLILSALLAFQFYYQVRFARNLKNAGAAQNSRAINEAFSSLKKALLYCVVSLALEFLHYGYSVLAPWFTSHFL